MQFANVCEYGSPVLLCGVPPLCLCRKPAVSCDCHMMYCSSSMSFIAFNSSMSYVDFCSKWNRFRHHPYIHLHYHATLLQKYII